MSPEPLPWDDARIVAFDVETSGTFPEYALQPWRVKSGDTWLTSASALRHQGGQLMPMISQLFPTRMHLLDFLLRVVDEDLVVLGWNITFDISMLMAHGPEFEDLCMRIRWLDGMLLWKHLEIEPEYEFQSRKHLKRRWRLKPEGVDQWISTWVGKDEDVDFHSTDPADLAKLQAYNDRDNVRAWVISKMIWGKLTYRQQRAALIEAEALPMVAQANMRGMMIDGPYLHDLGGRFDKAAAACLDELAPHGVTEKIVRSPKQLATLMYDVWNLPVLKENQSKVEGKAPNRSTDKEVLHELAFMDPRAGKIKEYREALNAKGKFVDSVRASLEYNGGCHTHPIAMIMGTYTGRQTVASKQGRGREERQVGFALHQMMRDKAVREIVIADPGYDILEFDAAGQEFRWMAEASGDETMLDLCQPGEDAHSFMGAQIVGINYRDLVKEFHDGDKQAVQHRYLGKFANLCCAEGTRILTDRGFCNIEQVRSDDLVWDGVEFVAHDGVTFSGVLPVITHCGVSTTPDHKVLVNGSWVQNQEAADYGWAIEPALGASRAGQMRSAVWIVGGLVRRAVREVGCALRARTLRLRPCARGELALFGGGSIDAVQGLCFAPASQARRSYRDQDARGSKAPEARQRVVSAMSQPEGPVVAQLWRAWDRVQVLLGSRRRGMGQGQSTASDVSQAGHRPARQRWSLRGWKPAAGYTQGQLGQPTLARCYDIVNCGPRTRFAANGVIVHNSLQYRTSPRKLRSKARVEYGIPLEMPEAQRIHKTYQRSYPGVPRYWSSQIELVKELGYVETFGGSRVNVVGDWVGRDSWSMGSTAINTRIQGTGADQKYLAMKYIRPILHWYGARFLFDLHDGLYLLVPKEHTIELAHELKYMLDNLPYQAEWGFTPRIPMPWDCKVGPSWGKLKDFDFTKRAAA